MATLSLSAGAVNSEITPSNTAVLEHIADLMKSQGLDPAGFTTQQQADWLIQWVRAEIVSRVNSYRMREAAKTALHTPANLDNE